MQRPAPAFAHHRCPFVPPCLNAAALLLDAPLAHAAPQDCGRAVECAITASNIEASCACGTRFCFGCGEEAHRPATCDTVRLWRAKNTAESGNATWILANTKPCPKCTTAIEKNQGCKCVGHGAGRVGGHRWRCPPTRMP